MLINGQLLQGINITLINMIILFIKLLQLLLHLININFGFLLLSIIILNLIIKSNIKHSLLINNTLEMLM